MNCLLLLVQITTKANREKRTPPLIDAATINEKELLV